MRKRSSKVEAWHISIFLPCAVTGILLGMRIYAEMINNGVKPEALLVEAMLIIASSFTVWSATHRHLKQKLAKQQKEAAKKSIKGAFELLKTASRTLDNIDVKAGTILNGSTSNSLDRALAYEYMQNVRIQVVEMYNDVCTYIEDWREVLEEEFDRIEANERMIDKIVIDQLTNTRKLHELERREDANPQEIKTIRAELDRLAERQRVSRSNILSESRKLVGAPITTIVDITSASYYLGSFEPIIKQPIYLNTNNEVQSNR